MISNHFQICIKIPSWVYNGNPYNNKIMILSVPKYKAQSLWIYFGIFSAHEHESYKDQDVCFNHNDTESLYLYNKSNLAENMPVAKIYISDIICNAEFKLFEINLNVYIFT